MEGSRSTPKSPPYFPKISGPTRNSSQNNSCTLVISKKKPPSRKLVIINRPNSEQKIDSLIDRYYKQLGQHKHKLSTPNYSIRQKTISYNQEIYGRKKTNRKNDERLKSQTLSPEKSYQNMPEYVREKVGEFNGLIKNSLNMRKKNKQNKKKRKSPFIKDQQIKQGLFQPVGSLALLPLKNSIEKLDKIAPFSNRIKSKKRALFYEDDKSVGNKEELVEPWAIDRQDQKLQTMIQNFCPS